ncbi:hypothetical protein GCM10011514_39090 [Emticicia aquatilis]|uniref:Uncharacterized protein n=1 Tax=Emticicia aquatilis TaxID=1537369 RepID=A0A916Z1D1_9BACT|nr:hypothetical protein GCM10011514_39090 [Emticicia aquatilis]
MEKAKIVRLKPVEQPHFAGEASSLKGHYRDNRNQAGKILLISLGAIFDKDSGIIQKKKSFYPLPQKYIRNIHFNVKLLLIPKILEYSDTYYKLLSTT